MFDKNSLGIRLRELRQSNNLTQGQVADYIGCLQSSLSNIERGVKPASFDIILSLANYYGVSLDYLLGATDFPYPLSEKVVNIINQANNPEELITTIQKISQLEKTSQTTEQSDPSEINDLTKDLDEDSIKELMKYADYLKIRQTLDKGGNEGSAGLDTASGK